jgi:hypothetical protein
MEQQHREIHRSGTVAQTLKEAVLQDCFIFLGCYYSLKARRLTRMLLAFLHAYRCLTARSENQPVGPSYLIQVTKSIR